MRVDASARRGRFVGTNPSESHNQKPTARLLGLVPSTTLPTMALLALIMLSAPFASAQESDEAARPDDAAWVEDCPPDTMCAAGAREEDDATKGDEPTYSGDCGADVCAYDGGAPGSLGPDGCIDCMAPVDPASEGDAAARKSVPGTSLAAALGILAVAALGVAILSDGRRR